MGPWEVLATWAQGWPDDGVSVVTVADHDRVLRCAKGARVLAERTWDDPGPFDVLVWPGGRGTRSRLGTRRCGRGSAGPRPARCS
ncbi:MAG: DJ-1/PfpI family protein [Actinomycetota bacterium]|nr:DJ-1/PfpI family protein [Actinomycetota bacterium]